MSRVIEVTVSPKGEVTMQTRGYSGSTCRAASRFLEQALGLTTAEQKTGEFYGDQTTDQVISKSQ